MKSNLNRRKEIFREVLPPLGSPNYKAIVSKIQANENPEVNRIIKKNWEKAVKSLEAQYLSNCDLVTENALRYFLGEFNNRAWKHGLRSLPIMFNIVEAFFHYRKPEIYFELIEEENYLISFFDFVDFITSNDFKESPEIIDKSIVSDLIYNFNVSKDLKEITFKNKLGDEFIIAGVSIVRRGQELTILTTTGRKKRVDESLADYSFDFPNSNPNKASIINEAKKNLAKENIEYVYLDEEKEYIKVLVACRVDLETLTIDARYVAEETNLSFKVSTDEIDGFLNNYGEFISNDLELAYINSREQIEDYSPIFEALKISLYLPYFFNKNEEIIFEENLETNFKGKYSSPYSKRKYKNTFGYKCALKPLYILDTNNILSPDRIKLRDDLFKVQTKGYWKKIPLENVGTDKKGRPIHGKTWVNQNLSWFEAKESDLVVEKVTEPFSGANAGYIYIMRNPVMETNVFKIGLTRKEVELRAKQLSKTSVPDKFYKSQEWNVRDCVAAEKEIHKRLSDYRVDPRREFFNVNYDKAIKVIRAVVEEVNNNKRPT